MIRSTLRAFRLSSTTFAIAFVLVGGTARAQQTPPAAPASVPQTPPGTPAQVGTDPIAGPIRNADTVRVVVAGAETLGGEFRVDADGTIFVPRLGQITLAGKSLPDAARDVGKRIEDKKLLKRADVAVSIVARKAREVVINGAVTTQGRQTIKDGAVLAEALEAAAPLPGADLSRIVITRGGKDTSVDYKRYRSGESASRQNNPVLEDDDRVYVYAGQPAEGNIRVTGEVKDSTKVLIPISQGTTAGQVLQAVGGLTDYADRNNIVVVRGDERIPVPYDDIVKNIPGRDVVLRDRDELRIPRLERPRQFSVNGAVRNAGDFPLQTKVTLLDAVARAGGPVEGAQQNKVELRRRDAKGAIITHKYDLQNDQDAAVEVADGDTIAIPYAHRRNSLDIGAVVGIISGIAVIYSTLRR